MNPTYSHDIDPVLAALTDASIEFKATHPKRREAILDSFLQGALCLSPLDPHEADYATKLKHLWMQFEPTAGAEHVARQFEAACVQEHFVWLDWLECSLEDDELLTDLLRRHEDFGVVESLQRADEQTRARWEGEAWTLTPVDPTRWIRVRRRAAAQTTKEQHQ